MPSVGPTHGVHATANAAPAISGPPEPARDISASGRHSRLSFGTNGVTRNSTPSAMITAPATLSSVPRPSWQRRAEAGRGHAERDEDDGEREAEDDRRQQHARQALLAVLDLGQRDAGDGRQVAGHERQHARRDERDEADRERGDHRGVDAAGSPVEGRQLGVEPARVVGVELGPASVAAGRAVRRQRRASSADAERGERRRARPAPARPRRRSPCSRARPARRARTRRRARP